MKRILVCMAAMSLMCMAPGVCLWAQEVGDSTAKAFLEKLSQAAPVTEADNKAGIFIESVTRSGEDYIVNYKCTNTVLWGSNQNRMFLMTRVYFVDPEKYENTYQPFVRKKDGTASFNFKEGDELGFPVRRIAFEPPSKVMYLYFMGIGSDSPKELQTVPLFFTIVLGDNPHVHEATPRYAGELFKVIDEKDKKNK